jgi:hypothetical protein
MEGSCEYIAEAVADSGRSPLVYQFLKKGDKTD